MTGNTFFSSPYWLINDSNDQQAEFVVVLSSIKTVAGAAKQAQQLFDESNIVINSSNMLPNQLGIEYFIKVKTQAAWKLFQKLLQSIATEVVDVFVLPRADRQKKLLICDMDCTIVKTETLDDIAMSIGVGEQVSEITAKAMRGELDFCEALDERVKLFEGTSLDKFDEIANTVEFNAGADCLIKSAKAHGIRTLLVSGGFEPVVKVVANKLGFDRYVCNQLEISTGKLTGNVLEPIVDADMKHSVLKEEMAQMKILPGQVCAVGDGANDLPMLQAAGLGVGFEGKPLIRASTPYQINSSSLISVLLMMGIAR